MAADGHDVDSLWCVDTLTATPSPVKPLCHGTVALGGQVVTDHTIRSYAAGRGFEVGAVLGTGSFGRVFMARAVDPKSPVAFKVYFARPVALKVSFPRARRVSGEQSESPNIELELSEDVGAAVQLNSVLAPRLASPFGFVAGFS